jgi:methylmalonyl-CoA mutase
MATEHLLDEFAPVSTEAWEEAIARDLKGADCGKKLLWQTEVGLAVRPYYRADDLAALQLSDEAPGDFPYRRGSRTTGDWRIREEISIADPEAANQAARNAVVAGAEEIAFLGVAIKNASDLGLLLVGLKEIPVHFQRANEALLRLLMERLNGREDTQSISTGWNPLANPEFTADFLRATPSVQAPFTIDAAAFAEEGANAVDEIGFALATGIDYLAEMQERGVDIDRAANAVAFSFAIGSNYFFQIAKFRAFRMVWARAVESFGGTASGATTRIAARTMRWNRTLYDPHVNVLRATTEAMSAILGGADSVTVAPFDACYKEPDEASRRLARNTQIILKHEALLANVADPGAGSYLLETLTDSLARECWKSMQRIESSGGYRKSVADGALKAALAASRAEREKAIATRRRVLTGTNQFADASERALDRIDAARLTADHRGAEGYEVLRLRTERHAVNAGGTPRVLLAEFGDVKMRAARSTFAANFFACAGFEIATEKFSSADEIATCDADLIILCSSDAEYLDMATGLARKLSELGRMMPVIVAGNPETAEQLRAAGVADFIHVRSNPIEVLTAWQQRLGIKAE